MKFVRVFLSASVVSPVERNVPGKYGEQVEKKLLLTGV
jgi:hypothetical protein